MNDAAAFVEGLKQYRGIIAKSHLHTLRGQALAGDVDGARKGLERLLRRLNGSARQVRKMADR